MPRELTRRPVTVDDVDDVIALLTASDEAVLGRTDFTHAEIQADLRNEALEAQGWYDDAGTLVAYGWVMRVGDSEKVQVDAYVLPGHGDDGGVALGTELVAALEARGGELAREAGHDQVFLDVGVYRHDERTRQWMSARRFEVGTTFTRMRIDFDLAAAPPDLARLSEPGSGIRLRETDKSAADLQLAHRLDEDSFGEHYGQVPQTYEQFRRRLLDHGPDWSSLWIAELDGEPVGLLIGTEQFAEDDDAGYVRTIGVVPPGRGRGVAKALLRAYFAASQRAGHSAVFLHVDVANVTNALAVYEAVGMRPFLEIDAWAKRAPTS